MHKYHLISVRLKKLKPWELELRRSHWRERYQRRSERSHNVQYFGDAMDMFPSDEMFAGMPKEKYCIPSYTGQ